MFAMIPNKIKTPEQYEQLSHLIKKYHVIYFLGIKHKNAIIYKDDVQFANITFPNGCVIHYKENNKWHTTVYKNTFTTEITTISIHNDSKSNTTLLGFQSINDVQYMVHPKYKCIIKYIYNNKSYTTTSIIQKELVTN